MKISKNIQHALLFTKDKIGLYKYFNITVTHMYKTLADALSELQKDEVQEMTLSPTTKIMFVIVENNIHVFIWYKNS